MTIDRNIIANDLFAPLEFNEVVLTEERIKNEKLLKDKIKRGLWGSGRRFLLRAEAHVLKLAHAYNKIQSLSNSRTRILAHQVESTHIIVNAFKQRFLIADEVGLGKTIEAGLVIKEMIYRYSYERIIIVCPASLLYQWQNEMESKFNEHFIVMDRKVMTAAQREVGEGGNPWRVHGKLIVSIDFIKNKAFEEDLMRTSWDAVIFDEAHRLRRDANSSTLGYNTAEIMSEKTKSLLLLSATPFRGKLEELYFLIALIDKNLLGPFQSFHNEYCLEGADLSGLKRKLSEVVIRRTKKDIGGFTQRHARTIRFELYPEERLLYDETTKYVVEEFNRALQSENRAVGFVMTVFQKLLDSSSYALMRALENRSIKMEELIARAESCKDQVVEFDFARIGLENFTDDEEEQRQEDSLSVKKTIEELKLELSVINRLLHIARGIPKNKKGEKLLRLIKELKKKGHKKFIIFTQFRTTQDYLVSILKNFSCVIFNGSMSKDEKEEAILEFKEEKEIIIATEAGGEGRNMQFCDVLINYDLPWSPLKIEQRIGRIHRFGQENDVHIYNFSTRDTVAERVLQVLTEKLKLFEESIGTPDIMLGQVEDEVNLNTLFMELASGRKSKGEIESELNRRVEYARQSFEKLGDLTVTNRMDFNYDEYYRVTLREREFTNRRIEKFINDIIQEDEYAASYISPDEREGFYRVFTDPIKDRVGKSGVFDSEKALGNDSLEFLAFGHPVVDGIIDHCRGEEFGGETGTILIRGDYDFHGMIFQYKVTFRAMMETKELFTVIIDSSGEMDDFDLRQVEDGLMDQDFVHDAPIPLNELSAEIMRDYEDYFQRASEKILDRIDNRLFDLNETLGIQIDPEVEKINESYNKQICELEEKLDLQEGQMKWYGRDMRSAISRTRNRINSVRNELHSLLGEYRAYSGVKHEIELIGAGVIISRKNIF